LGPGTIFSRRVVLGVSCDGNQGDHDMGLDERDVLKNLSTILFLLVENLDKKGQEEVFKESDEILLKISKITKEIKLKRINSIALLWVSIEFFVLTQTSLKIKNEETIIILELMKKCFDETS